MIAKLIIETNTKKGKTILRQCFYTPPFKVLDTTEQKDAESLHLMLMTASPGILDNDQYDIKIDIGAGGSLHLHTQSYQRLFQMENGASQKLEVCMEQGAFFCFLPHPTVPHRASIFTTRNKIYFAEGCTIIWGEILTCGRKESGEQFCFSKYHSCTEFYLGGRLIAKENLLLQPALLDLSAIGQLEGYTHQASLLFLSPFAVSTKLKETLYAILLLESDISFGITALPTDGLAIRILGFKGEQLHGVLKKLSAHVQAYILLHKQAQLANAGAYVE